MTATLQAPPWTEPRVPYRRPSRRTAVALALVLALAAAWLWAGQHPRLEPGGLSQAGTFRVADDGVRQTRWVAPPTGGEGTVTVRNTGRLPVTLGRSLEDPFFAVLGYRPLEQPGASRPDPSAPLRARVTLSPGEEVAVQVRAALEPCLPFAAGTSAERGTLAVEATSLGVPSTQELPLRLPLTVVGPNARVPGCP